MTYSPPSPPFIKATAHGGSQTPRAIVIHATVSPCKEGGARSVAGYFARITTASAHYIVDPSEVIQSVGDHTVAYHCGWNQDSIGIELCDPQTGPGGRWDDKAHRAMLDRAAILVAQLCLAYNIEPTRPDTEALRRRGPHGIYGHNDSRLAFGHTSHVDPGPDFPWREFVATVRRNIDAAKKPAPKREPASVNAPNIDAADTALAKVKAKGAKAKAVAAARALLAPFRSSPKA